MNFQDAVSALRQLDALPELRRRHLVMLAADARTGADRARIVMMAKRENIEQRWATEQALKAEFSARARSAEDHPERPVEAPLRPSRRGQLVGAEEGTTHAGPRPVSVRYVEPMKTATETQTRERRPLMGTNRKYPSAPAEPVPVPEVKPIKHGLTAYADKGCRCDICRLAKRNSRTPSGARTRRPPGELAPHGTTTRYQRGKCRCDQCRAAKLKQNREYLARKRSAQSPQ